MIRIFGDKIRARRVHLVQWFVQYRLVMSMKTQVSDG